MTFAPSCITAPNGERALPVVASIAEIPSKPGRGGGALVCDAAAMPIANWFLRAGVSPVDESVSLTALWSEESGIGDEQMTINLVSGTSQHGAGYGVMAFLHLPSLWSSEQVRQLQLSLARALCRAFGLEAADVQVLTTIVEPGLVVEDGRIQEW